MTLPQFTNLLLSLAPYLVPVIAALLFPIVKSMLDRLPATARTRIAEIVSTAVNATEQVMAPNASPAQRKSEAIRRIEAMLAQAKLSIPASVYDSMLEEAVFMLNVLEGKVGASSTPSPIVSALDAATFNTEVIPKFMASGKEGAK